MWRARLYIIAWVNIASDLLLVSSYKSLLQICSKGGQL